MGLLVSRDLSGKTNFTVLNVRQCCDEKMLEVQLFPFGMFLGGYKWINQQDNFPPHVFSSAM